MCEWPLTVNKCYAKGGRYDCFVHDDCVAVVVSILILDFALFLSDN
jgi:hypothetical protein